MNQISRAMTGEDNADANLPNGVLSADANVYSVGFRFRFDA